MVQLSRPDGTALLRQHTGHPIVATCIRCGVGVLGIKKIIRRSNAIKRIDANSNLLDSPSGRQNNGNSSTNGQWAFDKINLIVFKSRYRKA